MAFNVTKDFPEAHSIGRNDFHDRVFLPLRTLALLLLFPLLFAQVACGKSNPDLLEAAQAGNTAEVEQLLEQGADVNAKDEYGGTALMWAARKGHTEMVNALIDAGADVNAKMKGGWTALMFAAGEGYTGIVEILIGKGADVNVKGTFTGLTALMIAAKEDHTGIVEILRKAGAEE
ncbi:MAG: ankyrin repeat domain-containing protein [Acidobacteriota bacterium]|nr:MAG: ankyrin repeat domain-containing protein [Acidobacteriota bacterium]